MPTLLSGRHPPEVRVQPGDVLFVDRKGDKEPISGERASYREYVLVQEIHGSLLYVWRLAHDKSANLYFFDHDVVIYFVPEDEWPDAVHAVGRC